MTPIMVAALLRALVVVTLCAGALSLVSTYQHEEHMHVDWHGEQTCLFSSEDTGSKLGNICSRLDPDTHWALRQRI